MAVVDTERATPEDAQSCFGRFLEEKAILAKEYLCLKEESYVVMP